MKEFITLSWNRSDGLLRSSISFPVGSMNQAADLLALLSMTSKNLLSPEPEMDDSDEKETDTCGHA